MKLTSTIFLLLASSSYAFTTAPATRIAPTAGVAKASSFNPASSMNIQYSTVNVQRVMQNKPEIEEAETLAKPSIRRELGKLTGVSFSAMRATVRGTTGISLTAIRTFLRALTGVSISRTVKSLVGLLPPWFRYFLQPFLVFYYVPLLILKGLVGSTSTSKQEAMASHLKLVEYYKEAVKLANSKDSEFPIHMVEDGTFTYDLEDGNMNDALVRAIQMKHLEKELSHS
ncbi:hypothetical protein CTEN210_17110 [Chaetoceros tenuissimus]|uniref:Uncharacterized protein n=1 Tax=Chaetoceros tenuissimus TaxID=426638 RepID=A0AAD3HEX4_9STRA|nr:hypothetical protein CTEN210_17110 [Chaetoceros tenuissimus]